MKLCRSFHGFTLVETLCVLFIIGLIAGLCLPQLKKLRTEDESTRDIEIICHALKDTRYRSITEKIPYQVSFSDECITVNGIWQEKFSHGTQIGSSNNPFWFYPTGRATPGEIVCNEQTITVNASGRFKIEKSSEGL
ncbi:prepilin-type N-terminal cleavage/methylation domain-containing protein [Candidatus Desantisbacteria bacterium]|nr:prepilin-type N-terminal cleavage/methylation domain-containing protein [Candidatus Desantisbacteria bacterium]